MHRGRGNRELSSVILVAETATGLRNILRRPAICARCTQGPAAKTAIEDNSAHDRLLVNRQNNFVILSPILSARISDRAGCFTTLSDPNRREKIFNSAETSNTSSKLSSNRKISHASYVRAEGFPLGFPKLNGRFFSGSEKSSPYFLT
jgi:hypothetical protein